MPSQPSVPSSAILIRTVYRSLLKAGLKFETDYRKFGSMKALLHKMDKSFIPFRRSDFYLESDDAQFGQAISNNVSAMTRIRGYYRHPTNGMDLEFAFKNLRELTHINENKRCIIQLCTPIIRSPLVKYNVGDKCTNTAREWAGVILAFDSSAQVPTLHNAQSNPLTLNQHRDEPFYYVACNDMNSPTCLRYEPQANLHLVTSNDEFQTLLEKHKATKMQDYIKFFFPNLDKSGHRYLPNEFLRRRYPDSQDTYDNKQHTS
jgi:heat shock protein HspQ